MLFCISEISKNEDMLKEYMLYKQFLDSLTPQASFVKLMSLDSVCYSNTRVHFKMFVLVYSLQ